MTAAGSTARPSASCDADREPAAATPVFTASAATINEDGTSAGDHLDRQPRRVDRGRQRHGDGDDFWAAQPVAERRGANRQRVDGSFTLTVHSATGRRTRRPDHHACGLVRGQHSVHRRGSPRTTARSTSATVSHDATLTVNPLPETPVFTAAAATINEDGTSAVTDLDHQPGGVDSRTAPTR